MSTDYQGLDLQINTPQEARAFLATTGPIGRHVPRNLIDLRARAMNIIMEEKADKTHRARQTVAHCSEKRLDQRVLRRFDTIATLHDILLESDSTAIEFAIELAAKIGANVSDLLKGEDLSDPTRILFEAWKKREESSK